MSVLFGDLLSHSYNITFSMFLDLVAIASGEFSSLNNSLILEKKLASSNKGAKVTSGLSSESL